MHRFQTGRRTLAACMFGLLAALLLPLSAAPSQEMRGTAPAPPATPVEAAWQAAANALQRGPQTITLRNQGQLVLPEGYGFVPLKQAQVLMEALGNLINDDFVGMVMPIGKPDEQWLVTIDYQPAGFIKDDEASRWKSDELLEQLKQGAQSSNERRAKLGIPALEVARWIEAPAYDAATQRLIWSIEASEIGAPRNADATVNYNIYVLGREGYLSLNMITSTSRVESDKPSAKTLMSAVSFNAGKRYGDFDSTTDKVAAYGLAALVGGIAVKKLGPLALANVFVLKFSKVILVGLLLLLAATALRHKFVMGPQA